jgi:predicted GNAT family acetyltransferase
LSFLLLHDPAPATRALFRVVRAGGRVTGVACFGPQLVLAGDDAAAETFARNARRRDGERTIVGPAATVRAFWKVAAENRPQPRIVRQRQLVMAVDRRRLIVPQTTVEVRAARRDEWRTVADNSAQMIEHEIGYDPRRGAPDFGAQVRGMIARERWWVGEAHGRLCFFCSVGAWCRQTAQLQGVWTPPDLRRRGLAAAALAGICDRLLNWIPTLSLYVNDFNDAAIALYRRVGFEDVAEFQTLMF